MKKWIIFAYGVFAIPDVLKYGFWKFADLFRCGTEGVGSGFQGVFFQVYGPIGFFITENAF
jgi:hypothetical protein